MKLKTKVVFNEEQFAKFGFDGKIASYMRDHRNSAIERTEKGSRVVLFNNLKQYLKTR